MPAALLPDRLLRRELGCADLYTKPKGIYGDKKWVEDLDIVNELDGHSGCVNALSWSKSGRLLASGSDDTHLNIHAYQPEHTNNPFALTRSVATGHSANIFSVKFMPHSNDRTVITAAGDAQIRIFDVDRATSTTTSQSMGGLNNGVRYLSEGDTNARVFRSHSDRVKRIVTESSPYLFLSCSEDGEIRQWDTRQPSSAYPRPRTMRRFLGASEDTYGDVPPALISYKPYSLELNTISCSPSQPHYIALGGGHLHCFLHDRRMLGRDILHEQGKSPTIGAGAQSSYNDEIVSTATRCVKKFAPKGQQRMKQSDTGHITACKISDANPNELIASWSGDWIYKFDLLRNPDVREDQESAIEQRRQKRARAKESRNRKRKRDAVGSAASLEGHARSASKAKTSEDGIDDDLEASMALRVRYENGQSEDIRVAGELDEDEVLDSSDDLDISTVKVAKTMVEIRKCIFALNYRDPEGIEDPTGHSGSFAEALSKTLSILEDMDVIMRTWRYPVEPDESDVIFQNMLRSRRDRSRRFVQACGTVSRVLAGQAAVASNIPSLTSLEKVNIVRSSTLEREISEASEQFCYDFVKAICLWLESGPSALAQHFAGKSTRRPLPKEPSIEDIDEALIPYLLSLASSRSIPNIDTSRFEINENRVAFSTEVAAVHAFAKTIKIPFTDLSKDVASETSTLEHSAVGNRKATSGFFQGREQAIRFWGMKIARGVLMNAGEGINYAFVERAFGGLGKTPRSVRKEEQDLARQTEDIQSDDDDNKVVSNVGGSSREMPNQNSTNNATETKEERARRIHQKLTGANQQRPERRLVNNASLHDTSGSSVHDEMEGPAAQDVAPGTISSATEEALRDSNFEDITAESDDDMSSSETEPGDGDNSIDEEEEDEEDEDDPMTRNFLLRSSLSRSSARSKCNKHVPGIRPQLHYEGAANVRTVKDVNFYGLNDEYVVSGSDSGHLFIWDRASGQLMNILEGDNEVVNVVQGHPYEPMLAVSGIDHSIKIFSSDKRARNSARKGVCINNTGHSGFSTLGMGGRTRPSRARRPPRESTQATEAAAEGEPLLSPSELAVPEIPLNESDTEAEEAAMAPNGLPSRRRMHLRAQITAENDVERRGAHGPPTFITRGMLAQLAARFQMRQAGGGDGDGGGEAGEDAGGEADEGGDQVFEIQGHNIVLQGNGDCAVQ